MPSSSESLTVQLKDLLRSSAAADRDELFRLLAAELSRIAHALLQKESPGHSLETAVLVNDAYLQLVERTPGEFASQKHFFCTAARLMRRLLVDRARYKKAAIRGGQHQRVDGPLETLQAPVLSWGVDLLALERSLQTLEQLDPRQGQILELSYFSGHTIKTIAALLEISEATVKRELHAGRVWLAAEIRRLGEDEAFRQELRRLEEDAVRSDRKE